MIDFPSSPTVGQQFTAAGVTWTWDGVKWTSPGAAPGVYLPLIGGTMTGDLILNRDPQVALGAATKQSVDARGAGDNRIINGDMRINQRSNGPITVSAYLIDRWIMTVPATGRLSYTQSAAGAGLIQLGYGSYLSLASTSAYTPAATDIIRLQQSIEADMVSDFAWGTTNAQPVTLSFLAQSSLTGSFSGCVADYAGTRSYPFTFSLPTANVWTKIAVTIPGDTAGSWVMSGNGGAVRVCFDLGSGANFRGPAGAWASGNLVGVTGSISLVGTNGATFYLTGVKLEIGSVATPFNRQSLAKSMVDCQRYYQTMGAGLVAWGYGIASSVVYGSLTYPPMRAAPTVSYSSLANGNSTGCSVNSNNASILVSQCTVTAAGMGFASAAVSLTAELMI